MATFHKGDMWDRLGKVDLFCITTNGTIKKDGRLVMGAGIAKEARDRLPGIDRNLAEAIQRDPTFPHTFWPTENNTMQRILPFQVKNHFREMADINLIEHSCYLLLREILNRLTLYGYTITVALNFPGIGYGGLERNKVLPIISILPDNVEIWEKK